MEINGIIKAVCIMVTLIIMILALCRWFRRGHSFFEGVLWVSLFAGFIYSTYLLLNTEINQSHDMIASMSRINDMAVDIDNKTFPSVIMKGQANGFGCAGILYPHLFYYIPAFLRYIGASTVCAYQVFIWFCQVFAAFVMFVSVKLILSCVKMATESSVDVGDSVDYPAIIATLLFLCYPYRVANLYWRGALSESYAMIFIALLTAAFICIVKGRKKTDWVFLCLAISGLLQTHVLTLVMAVIISIVFCLVFIKDVIRKDVIVSLALAVISAIVINLWYIVPFLKFFSFESNIDGMMYAMSEYGTTIPGLLKGISYEQSRPGIIGIVGFFVLFVDIVCLFYVIKKKLYDSNMIKLFAFMTVTSAISLFISTKYFPWDWFQSIVPSVGIFQFPFRFILITCVFSVMAFALVMKILKSCIKHQVGVYALLVITGIFLIMGTHNILTCLDVTEELFGYSTNDFDFDYRIEYLPKGATSSYFADSMPVISDGVQTLAYFKDINQVTWQYQTQTEGGYFQAPLIYYPGYNAMLFDNSGNYVTMLETNMADNYRVQVDLPEGYDSGIIVIRYEGIWYFRYCAIISLIGIFGLVGYMVFRKNLLIMQRKNLRAL